MDVAVPSPIRPETRIGQHVYVSAPDATVARNNPSLAAVAYGRFCLARRFPRLANASFRLTN